MAVVSEEEKSSYQRAKDQLDKFGLGERIILFPVSSATVELAAQALGCSPSHIAKTLSFKSASPSKCILLVTAGDARIDNQKFKSEFKVKTTKMLSAEEVISFTGLNVGGVCPFGVINSQATEVYLDESLKRFEYIFPAAGTHNSGVKLTPLELEKASQAIRWVDVCKCWRNDTPSSSSTPTTPSPSTTPMN